jgi:hypothetical protein
MNALNMWQNENMWERLKLTNKQTKKLRDSSILRIPDTIRLKKNVFLILKIFGPKAEEASLERNA